MAALDETPLFRQNTIALIWDFDKTLTPGYMQEPLFEHFGVSGETFWAEVKQLAGIYAGRGQIVAPETLYLNHILTYVEHGAFAGLSNELLREFGARIGFFPGLPGFFRTVQESVLDDPEFRALELQVEHYIVSTGLRQMILGSPIAPLVAGVYGSEFVADPPPPGLVEAEPTPDLFHPNGSKLPTIRQIGYLLDNTSKTRAIFEINKGVNKNPTINVNSKMAHGDRRVPVRQMICIADGPSDVPMFSVVNQFGGETFAVYDPDNQEAFQQADRLARQGRVNAFGPADYREGSHTHRWILAAVRTLARGIVERHRDLVERKVEPPPRHLDD